MASAKNKDLGSTCTPLKPELGLFKICLNYGMLTRVDSTFQGLILPSSCLLWQIDGSTCTPYLIELLIIFMFSGDSKK